MSPYPGLGCHNFLPGVVWPRLLADHFIFFLLLLYQPGYVKLLLNQALLLYLALQVDGLI